MKWIPFLAAMALCACAHAPENPALSSADHQNNEEEAREPLVVQNPDGTITVQHDAADKKGLVIKPQVVKPTAPAPRDN